MGASRRIVLYFPKLVDEARGIVASRHHLPLSLLTIAGWPDRDGYDVRLIDGNLYSEDESRRRVAEACEGALLYGTTGILGYQVADAARCTVRVKEAHPDLPSFIGGWFASSAPELQLATGLYDAVALGQGEMTFRELVSAVEVGEPLDAVSGLALMRDGSVVYTPPRPVVGWGQLVDCPWHLLDFEPYRRGQLVHDSRRIVEPASPPPGSSTDRPHVAISYYSSFGCPVDCTFCCSPEMTGRRWKAMPADRMLDDLCSLQDRWSFDVVHFYDANWSVSQKRAREFADGLLERDNRLHYLAYFQTDAILAYEEETLDRLVESGLYAALIGAESGTEETTGWLHKRITGDDNVRAAQALEKRGVSIRATYMIGLPGEDRDSMLATIDQCRRMAVECPHSAPTVWPYHPVPGAALYSEALALGFQPPRTLEEWGSFLEFRLDRAWPGSIPGDVARMHKLYNHFAHVAAGLGRGRFGIWERWAQRRLEDAEGFHRGWPLGLTEARAFHVVQRLGLGGDRRGIDKGWKSRRGVPSVGFGDRP